MEPVTVVTALPMSNGPVGPRPAQMVCRSCHSEIITKVVHKATSKTHTAAFLMCLFCCWACFCVPYCMNSCRNADHFCPNCNAYIGSYAS